MMSKLLRSKKNKSFKTPKQLPITRTVCLQARKQSKNHLTYSKQSKKSSRRTLFLTQQKRWVVKQKRK